MLDPIEGLKRVKEVSLIFNSEVYGSIYKRKRKIERRLKGIQASLERIDSARLVLLEQQLQQDYDNILFQEEIHWCQKSREKWVILGDRNTKCFHAQTVIRRKRNKIHGLTIPSGTWCTEDAVLQAEAEKFFKELFSPGNSSTNHHFQTRTLLRLDDSACNDLTIIVTRDEVIKALHQMHPYKSPGPDDFQAVFFRHLWDTIGNDVVYLITEAFAIGYFDPSIAETLIALIPKMDCPTSFKEFRPISLSNTIYKLITKILVNRIKPLLDSIIGPYQRSFLPGRGTSDNAIILQEATCSVLYFRSSW